MKYYSALINEKGNIALDDTILVKGEVATAGSRILENYKPLFSAEAVTRLEEKGYTVSIDFAVKVIYADEFGVDSAEQLRGFIKGVLSELSSFTKAICSHPEIKSLYPIILKSPNCVGKNVSTSL